MLKLGSLQGWKHKQIRADSALTECTESTNKCIVWQEWIGFANVFKFVSEARRSNFVVLRFPAINKVLWNSVLSFLTQLCITGHIAIPYLWVGCLWLVHMAVWESWLTHALWAGQCTFRHGSLVVSEPKERGRIENMSSLRETQNEGWKICFCFKKKNGASALDKGNSIRASLASQRSSQSRSIWMKPTKKTTPSMSLVAKADCPRHNAWIAYWSSSSLRVCNCLFQYQW